jgi:inward rectifier potassium channel
LSFALITGLFFARFSKPQARIIFSNQCIVTPFEGGKALMVRIANLRNNRITDVEVRMTMTYVENTTGRLTRKYIELPLQMDRVVTLPLNWTIVHKIDEISPLKGHNKESFKALRPEILLFIKAYDETYAQQVYANSSFVYSDIEWGVRFKTMYEAGHRGTILHLDQINTTEPIEFPPEEDDI